MPDKSSDISLGWGLVAISVVMIALSLAFNAMGESNVTLILLFGGILFAFIFVGFLFMKK